MDYRLYVFDSAGQVARAEEWSCASEAQALERASRLVNAFGAELWQGARHVSTFAGRLAVRAAEAGGEARA